MADFCSVADLEDWLQIAIAEDKTASAQRAIAEASASIRNYCHQAFDEAEDDEVTLDGTGTHKLLLPQLPVVEVAAVEVEDYNGDMDALDVDDYRLGQHGILYRLDAVWPAGIQNIQVTYSHGYETIPDDIQAICVRAAGRAYQAGLRADEAGGVPGIASTSLGDYAVSFGAEGGAGQEGILGASAAHLLLPSEKRTLDAYRVKP